MSSSQGFSEARRFPIGRRPVRVPEKSNFSQTCSLLSQYLKEKGSFGDLNFGMTCVNNPDGKGKVGETFDQSSCNSKMNFLSSADASNGGGGVSERDEVDVASPKLKSMDLFPLSAGFGLSVPTEEVPMKAADTNTIIRDEIRATAELETAPMTIFYGGGVFVFDNVPAEKAKELMLQAIKLANFPNNNESLLGSTSTTTGDEKGPLAGLISALASNSYVASDNAGNDSKQQADHQGFQRPLQANASDLPLARRVSLRRFLEKRKDRVSEIAPYQLNDSAATSETPEESNSWLGLA